MVLACALPRAGSALIGGSLSSCIQYAVRGTDRASEARARFIDFRRGGLRLEVQVRRAFFFFSRQTEHNSARLCVNGLELNPKCIRSENVSAAFVSGQFDPGLGR